MLNVRYSFNLKCLASQFPNFKHGFGLPVSRNLATKEEKKQEEETLNFFQDPEEPEEIAAREALIEQKRNKSKLLPPDYNRQHDKVPYEQPLAEFHESLGYRRRLYGKFGEASGVNPSILWPSKKELEAIKEYEAVLQPYTFQELVARNRERKESEEKIRLEKEAQILEKVKKVGAELVKFHKKFAAEKQKALELAEKRSQLVERVRAHFGYKIDVRDQKFKDMMEEIVKKEKKEAKAAKRSQKEEKLKANQSEEKEKTSEEKSGQVDEQK